MNLSNTLGLATEASVRASNCLPNPSALLGGGDVKKKKNANQTSYSCIIARSGVSDTGGFQHEGDSCGMANQGTWSPGKF
jgi:hypothetical protein